MAPASRPDRQMIRPLFCLDSPGRPGLQLLWRPIADCIGGFQIFAKIRLQIAFYALTVDGISDASTMKEPDKFQDFMSIYKNPKWWTAQNDSSWSHVKAAMRRDWNQTKH